MSLPKSEFASIDLRSLSFLELTRIKDRVRGSDPRSHEIYSEWDRRVRLSDESKDRPTVVCLCGSTRFFDAFREANLHETLAGNIVLTVGCDMRSDADLFASMSDAERAAVKVRLDDLHLRKIDMADEILVLNVNSYIGDSTRRELEYAEKMGKIIRFLEPKPVFCLNCGRVGQPGKIRHEGNCTGSDEAELI